MKKFFIIAVMAVAAISASAQEVGKLFVTPKAGVNLASMTDAKNSKMRVGLVAGAELGYQTSEKNTITFGVLYSQQGVKSNENTFKNDYLNIPIMASYMLFPGFSIEAGLQPAFLLSAKIKTEVGPLSGEGDAKDAYNTFDFSLPVGISYEFSKVIIEARYNVGLLKCFDDDLDREGKNDVIQFTLGVKI